jgi:DNA-directed RNA polymerase subunit alpha
MELTVESGVGYAIADERKSTEIGVIPVDAIFSPVSAVNYTVDQTRVGRRTDFDKLTMVVTTDGSLTPLEAVNKSAEILSGYFHQIYDPAADEEVEEVKAPSFMANDMMKASIEELDLPVRICNALKAIDIDTIGKLTTRQPPLC